MKKKSSQEQLLSKREAEARYAKEIANAKAFKRNAPTAHETFLEEIEADYHERRAEAERIYLAVPKDYADMVARAKARLKDRKPDKPWFETMMEYQMEINKALSDSLSLSPLWSIVRKSKKKQ